VRLFIYNRRKQPRILKLNYDMWKKINGKHIFIFFIILGVSYTIWRKRLLDNNARYTIGFTGKIYWTAGSGRQLEYTYNIKGKNYTESENYLNYQIKGNCHCRYFVKYDDTNPDYSKLLLS
jgi:hypothetical protein